MICLQNANAYLKSRTLWDAWDEYSSDQKEMAITQARRDLSRANSAIMVEKNSDGSIFIMRLVRGSSSHRSLLKNSM